jgi:hypothetical protein
MAGVTAHDIRVMALALPGAEEADHHGSPSFVVKGKIFCTLRETASRMMVKLSLEDQFNFCAAHGEVVSPVPGYWGRKGSTYVALDRIDRALAETLLSLGWARIAQGRKALAPSVKSSSLLN